jgi:transcription antitermination protein NusB
MGPRRRGRELALQALYRVETTGDESGEGIELLWHTFDAADLHDGDEVEEPEGIAPEPAHDAERAAERAAEARRFAAELVRGVVAERERIDDLVREAARRYRIERLSRVDLNVLRIAVHELLHPDERVPTSVVLDEAIEIARRFGSEGSAPFVNGVLDAIAGRLGRGRGLPAGGPAS